MPLRSEDNLFALLDECKKIRLADNEARKSFSISGAKVRLKLILASLHYCIGNKKRAI